MDTFEHVASEAFQQGSAQAFGFSRFLQPQARLASTETVKATGAMTHQGRASFPSTRDAH